MGGICGWLGGEGNGSPGADAADVVGIMKRAMAHRGAITSIEQGVNGAEGPVTFAADSPEPGRAALARAWDGARGDSVAFASALEGPFAIAVHDRPGRRLVLVRDRMGEKPLCYATPGGGLAFASEMKALVAAGLVAGRQVRPEALDAYLAFTYVPAPWTILEGVHKVPAGHVVEIDLQTRGPCLPRLRRYWSAPLRERLRATPGEALSRLREALKRRLPSNGGLAAFLSGGLDSSLVVALLREEGFAGLPTFSVGFEDPSLDESAHARHVATLLGTDHREIILRDVAPDLVERIIAQLDEPMADAAAVPTWILARAASEVAPVAITGDGADALLAGDHWFRRLQRLDHLVRMPEAGRRLVAAAASLGGRRRGARMEELAGLTALSPSDRYLKLREKWTPRERLEVYSESFRPKVDVALTARTYTGAPVRWEPGGSVDAAIRLDSIHGLPEDLLMKVDKMGMAHGVQCRSPFLDRAWVEWVSRIDTRLLLRFGTSKRLLKRAAAGLLPSSLIHRRKQGFRVPVGRWMRGPWRPLFEEAFSPGLLARQAIFDSRVLGALGKRFDAGPSSAAEEGRIWQIVCFQTWWRQHFG